MPLNIDLVQILLHILNFVILAGGLTLLLFKPVSKFIRERRERLENLKREAEENAAESARLKEEYEQKLAGADEEIARLRAGAEQEAAAAAGSYIDSAKKKAETIISEAEQEAEARKNQILESTHNELNELVITAAQKLVGSTETEDRTLALYDEFLEKAGQEGGEAPLNKAAADATAETTEGLTDAKEPVK